MELATDTILVLTALTSLLLLGSSRLVGCIRTVAFQGVLLGGFTFVAERAMPSPRALLLGSGIILLKGFVFPWLLARVREAAEVQREVEPFVSYNLSIVAGTVMLGVAFWLSARLTLPEAPVSSLVVPVSLHTTLCGLFLIVSRRKALTQVLGYVVLENGIYTFGVGVVRGTPMLVEVGVLLDVFVAVFVMGIAIFHINREFDHIDTDRLTSLGDRMA